MKKIEKLKLVVNETENVKLISTKQQMFILGGYDYDGNGLTLNLRRLCPTWGDCRKVC